MGRADAKLGLGERVLHRLREDMGGGVAEDRQALGGVHSHGLDDIALAQGRGEIAQFTVDSGYDNGAVTSDDIERGGAGSNRLAMLTTG